MIGKFQEAFSAPVNIYRGKGCCSQKCIVLSIVCRHLKRHELPSYFGDRDSQGAPGIPKIAAALSLAMELESFFNSSNMLKFSLPLTDVEVRMDNFKGFSTGPVCTEPVI